MARDKLCPRGLVYLLTRQLVNLLPCQLVNLSVRVSQFHQVLAVFGLAHLLAEAVELVEVYPTLAPGYLFDAGDTEALAVLDGGYEVGGFEQAVAVAGVEPGEAAAEEFDTQGTFLQVEAVEVGDFVLAAGRRLERSGFLRHGMVVEVESGDGVVALGLLGLLFEGEDAAVGAELDDTVGAGVFDVVAEDTGALLLRGGAAQHAAEALAVEQVIAQDEAAGSSFEEVGAQDEGLRQAVGFLLHDVGELHAQLFARAQQFAEHGQVAGGGDDEHLADAGQHQGGQGVVNHGLVVDGHDLLGDGFTEGIEAGGAAAGKNNSFHILVPFRVIHYSWVSTKLRRRTTPHGSRCLFRLQRWEKGRTWPNFRAERWLLVSQFDDLQVAELPLVDAEAHQGADGVEALAAGSAGVDVQQAERLVVLHLEDVRVSADKQLGRACQQAAGNGRVVASGIAADVLHHDLRTIDGEAQGLWEEAAQFLPVDVAVDSTQGAEVGQSLGHLQGAYVAGVPDFVAGLEVLQVSVVPPPVGVRQESDSCHEVIRLVAAKISIISLRLHTLPAA